MAKDFVVNLKNPEATPEQLADKLNTLSYAIDHTVVRGVTPKKDFEDFKLKTSKYIEGNKERINTNDQRWHGGGLSRVSHDTTLTGDGTPSSPLSAVGDGTGTVRSVSVVSANGISGTVASGTTTPAITLTLGAITPTTVNGNTLTTGTGTLTLGAGKTLTSNVSTTIGGADGNAITLFGNAVFNTGTTFNGSAGLTFNTSGATTVTLPTTGTLATLTGAETLTNKVIAATRLTGVNSFAEATPVLVTGSERVQLEDADGNASDWSFRVASGGWGQINFAASSGTLASPTVVAVNRALGQMDFWGYDGTTYRRSASIDCIVSTTPGASDMPGKLRFYTTPDGSITPGLAFDLDHNKVAKFYGQLNINGNTILNTGTITFPTTTGTLALLDSPALTGTPTTPTAVTTTNTTQIASTAFVQQEIVANRIGYAIPSTATLPAPADATTYYFGAAGFVPNTTAGTYFRVYIPKAGTIKSIYITFVNGGTVGSSETSTVNFRLNNTTDTVISSSVKLDATTQVFSNTSLSIAVAAGDYYEYKWTTPTWVTNPSSSVVSYAVVYIE